MESFFRTLRMLRIGIVLGCVLLMTQSTRADGRVTVCDATALEAAMAGGGLVTLECSGTIALSRTLRVTRDTVLDASGQNVTLDGGGALRLIEVSSGATLRLMGLHLANGAVMSNTNAATPSEADALGAAVLVDQAELWATNCVFRGHSVQGGLVTNADIVLRVGGLGKGGAVCLRSGVATFLGCQFQGNHAAGGPVVLFGRPSENYGAAHGGAICLERGTLRLAKTTFDSNQAIGASSPGGGYGGGGAALGGAVYAEAGEVEIDGCRFLDNQVHPGSAPRNSLAGLSAGGALYLGTNITQASMSSSEFISNVCHGGTAILGNAPSMGGAIFNASTLRCLRSVFRGNSAGETGAWSKGGAIFNSGNLVLVGSRFSGNKVHGGAGGGPAGDRGYDASGGGLFSEGEARVEASAFVSNTAAGGDGDWIPGHVFSKGGSGYGGGIYAGGFLEVQNSVFTGNLAVGGTAYWDGSFHPGTGFGGGINAVRGPFRGVHLTFANNLASAGVDAEGNLSTEGTAGGAAISASGTSMTLLNSIVAETSAAGGCYGAFTTSKSNLSADGSCDFGRNGGWDRTDPRLGALNDPGNAMPFIPLLDGSPAIDAGDATECLATDQRGVPRPFGARCDLGAYEWNGPLPANALEMERAPNGNLSCHFVGLISAVGVLESSSDLKDWAFEASVVTDARGWWNTNVVPDLKVKFFRVRLSN
ncbi:MAG: hypothetical protein JNK85_04905 [Verrucomicrobiales bacterium]|nr:hypothetical protein [Verrucomicrobiales bacterium]